MPRIRYSPRKSLWLSGHIAAFALLALWHSSWSAVAVFVVGCCVTLCAGHSAGIHRGLIHRSYRFRSRPLKLLMAWLGTLVGMGGPISLYRLHNVRDRSQNRPVCPAYYRHGDPLLLDHWRQLHCVFEDGVIEDGGIAPEPNPWLEDDPGMQWLERWARWQQLPVALALFAVGGLDWVVWGVFGRVAIGVMGHWLVGWYCHNASLAGDCEIVRHGRAAQGFNHLLFGALSFGEGWHNNHHAFPGSARIGLRWYELDAGWMLIRSLEVLGLVDQVVGPEEAAERSLAA